MSTIRARRRKDGSVGYTARVRIRVKGQVVHQEIETFSTKSVAEKWAKRREVELEDPKELAKAQQGPTTLASVIRWYIDSFKHVSLWIPQMAKVKIAAIVEHLKTDMRRALEAAVKESAPEAAFNSHALFRSFRRAVRRKCNVWETVPDDLLEKDE